MNFSEIVEDKINIKYNGKFFDIKNDNEKLIFNTNQVYIPFGVEKNFNNYYLKILKNDESNSLFQFIEEIESKFIQFLNNYNSSEQVNFTSQIKKKQGYGDFLQLKIPYRNNQFILDIYDQENNRKTIFDIKKKQQLKLKLMIDNIWSFNDSYSAVIKVKSIFLV